MTSAMPPVEGCRQCHVGEPVTQALAGLAYQRHGLGEDHPDRVAHLGACSSGVPFRSIEPIAATVISTASLIALSAQATFWAPCICSRELLHAAAHLLGVSEQASESSGFHASDHRWRSGAPHARRFRHA